MKTPVVAIVGRPNVGKSQLFNRLCGRSRAIVQDEPGITRDRIYGQCDWRGKSFLLVDTGGLDAGDPDPLKILVQKQTKKAIQEASIVLFLVDAKEGCNPLDREISLDLRKSKKPVILLANKVDNFQKLESLSDFFELGLGEAFPISALHGINSGELLDLILEQLGEEAQAREFEAPRIAIVGRRNVGKSSLINAIVGEERSIVSEEAGTTRDSIDSVVELEEMKFTITDTSGLRRKGKIDEKVEYYSAVRTIKAIEDSDCAVLVLDASTGIVFQDKRVAEAIQKARKASIIVFNKWDTIEVREKNRNSKRIEQEYRDIARRELYFIDYSPILFVSALKGEGCGNILPEVKEVLKEYNRKLDTSLVNQIFHEAQQLRPAPSYKGEQLRIYYAFQYRVCPPSFSLKVNSPRLVHFSYKRYLENTLRRAIGFKGTPVTLSFKRK